LRRPADEDGDDQLGDVSAYRFDGRVAVVTGAGRGLGRAYARLLAARGAQVVVNDLGGSTEGDGADAEPASAVAAEIVGAGGTAIADHNDVASVDGADALIDRAVSQFGRVDIVVNNAGIVRWAGMPDVDSDNLTRHLAVHVGGSFNTTHAAWPRMVEQRYGRVVMTTSTGMLGLPNNTSYATAKGAVLGLARSLATAGTAHGITVNCVAPAAFTRMAGPPGPGTDKMAPELVAPIVAYLAHEACPANGEVYVAGAGRFARLFIAVTEGHVQTDATIEDVADHWPLINDRQEYSVPADLPAWSAAFMKHLPR
jgi:NAD(P)-dependent dehydrogenase (short-subunit alcohol dehydrogenase family)